jgi:hypothetical protein
MEMGKWLSCVEIYRCFLWWCWGGGDRGKTKLKIEIHAVVYDGIDITSGRLVPMVDHSASCVPPISDMY